MPFSKNTRIGKRDRDLLEMLLHNWVVLQFYKSTSYIYGRGVSEILICSLLSNKKKKGKNIQNGYQTKRKSIQNGCGGVANFFLKIVLSVQINLWFFVPWVYRICFKYIHILAKSFNSIKNVSSKIYPNIVKRGSCFEDFVVRKPFACSKFNLKVWFKMYIFVIWILLCT